MFTNLWQTTITQYYECGCRDHQFFLRFVNMLLNDATYLLDESLAKLAEIRTTQLLMNSPQWEAYEFSHISLSILNLISSIDCLPTKKKKKWKCTYVLSEW